MMTEERKMILQMLKDGELTVEEAERLLEAVQADGQSTNQTGTALEVASGLSPKRISVVVTERGKTKVNVKVPFSLVKAGIKLGQSFGSIGARYVKDGNEAAVLETLQTIDVDEILESLNDGEITLPYVMVDVDEEETAQHVRVVLE